MHARTLSSQGSGTRALPVPMMLSSCPALGMSTRWPRSKKLKASCEHVIAQDVRVLGLERDGVEVGRVDESRRLMREVRVRWSVREESHDKAIAVVLSPDAPDLLLK